MAKPKIVVVCGPTATGKTDLAFHLCRRFGGELVGADSMQIYKGLRIGTAAPEESEYPDVPRHLVGCLPPEEAFSVAEYVRQAGQAIDGIVARGRVPVVCGGTGLYIESLVLGIRFIQQKVDEARRDALEQDWDAMGAPAMLERLRRLDPDYAARLHMADKKRILRALEESEATGTTLQERNAASRSAPPPYNALLLGLDDAERSRLYSHIEARVDKMVQQGLLAEAGLVYRNRTQYATAAQAIGYKEFFPYFEETASLEECTDRLKQATRRYAKRQRTWFRRMEGIHWLEPGEGAATQAGALCAGFLQEQDDKGQ